MRLRFEVRQETDGKWEVINIFTGQVVVVEEHPLFGLKESDARDMANLLNSRRFGAREPLPRNYRGL
ncbi:hypothetical protein [Flaviflagellibacter deserti]|uniref:Uncharacterized protein n=1 Tax=Flaviflagellibacter deserti TaxID=2267266 RepID=A0ABV9YWZ3_9HYPH